MLVITWLQARYTSFSPNNSEEFTSASRSVKPGLIASGIVSAWTCALDLALWSISIADSARKGRPHLSGSSVRCLLPMTLLPAAAIECCGLQVRHQWPVVVCQWCACVLLMMPQLISCEGATIQVLLFAQVGARYNSFISAELAVVSARCQAEAQCSQCSYMARDHW